MPKNELKKDEFKVRIIKLKDELGHEPYSQGITHIAEPDTIWQGDRDMAHKYLDKVLNIIDEYRY